MPLTFNNTRNVVEGITPLAPLDIGPKFKIPSDKYLNYIRFSSAAFEVKEGNDGCLLFMNIHKTKSIETRLDFPFALNLRDTLNLYI